MSVEKIINQIELDSKKEITEILNEANKKADKILKDELTVAESKSKNILSDGLKKSESIKQIIISKENQKARKKITQTKEEIIERCFSDAFDKLKKFDGKEYNNFIDRHIKKGIERIGKNFNVKISRDSDKKIVKKYELKILEKINSIGGIILISGDNNITLDYTIEGILKREKDRIRIEIGKTLFKN